MARYGETSTGPKLYWKEEKPPSFSRETLPEKTAWPSSLTVKAALRDAAHDDIVLDFPAAEVGFLAEVENGEGVIGCGGRGGGDGGGEKQEESFHVSGLR
jgi:hypothetical protein